VKKRNIQISQPVTGEEEWLALKEPLTTGWLTTGPKVAEFERLFAEIHHVKYAVATTSATTALQMALAALDISQGDEVIVPAFTWVATANVVLMQGAKVVFCDIDPSTFNLNPEELQQHITSKTKAIIPVHLFGLCADMDAIKNIADGLPLIEDAACAAGAAYKGVPAGGLGDLGCFSFHPRKSITTGEGGMVTTGDEKLAEKLIMLRNHGASISEEQRHHGPKPYILPDFNLVGFNFRMTDLQGAIGIVQLKKLGSFIDERQSRSEFYMEQLRPVSWLNLPAYDKNFYTHGWQSFVTLVDESQGPISRNEVMEFLQDRGVSTRPGTHAVHMLNYYKNSFDIKPEDFPGAKKANDLSMAIPLHNRMTNEDYAYVVECLLSIK